MQQQMHWKADPAATLIQSTNTSHNVEQNNTNNMKLKG